jgi:hypothetical protein
VKSRICISVLAIALAFGACLEGMNAVSGHDNSKAEPSGTLSLKLSPPTYGTFGSSRTSPLIAGDHLRMMLDVSGLTVGDKEGCRNISVTSEVRDAQGKRVVGGEERLKHKFVLGGSSARYPVSYDIPRDVSPGKYTVFVRVVYHDSGEKRTVERPIEVLSKSDFGILNLKFSQDEDGILDASGSLTLTESTCVTGVIGGAKNVNGHIHFKSTLSILDENRKPVTPGYLNLDYEKDYSDTSDILVPIRYSTIVPNRVGKFILEIKATDVIADKTVTYELPMNVQLPPELPTAKK